MPYITGIDVIKCRNLLALEIDLNPKTEERDFLHLILTGPNGSGKTGLLDGLTHYLDMFLAPTIEREHIRPNTQEPLGCTARWSTPGVQGARASLVQGNFFYIFWPAHRLVKFTQVTSPKATFFNEQFLQRSETASLFKQFLVNRKTEQAFAATDGDSNTVQNIKYWFKVLWDYLKHLFEEPDLDVTFDRKNYNFIFTRGDGYQFDLDTLADGHAAALGILAELLLRIEAAKELAGQSSFQPEGLVVIDELEAHLHPSMQENILPFFTSLFPGLQFIVATHSPAVISSIDGAVVYDLKKREAITSEDLRGIRYGTLMTSHFGIDTDYDQDSTAKVERLTELHRKSKRTDEEEQEYLTLADELRRTSHTLAMEVWTRLQHEANRGGGDA